MAIQDEIPKSRLTLTYRTTINGAMQDVSLPFRILVLADFSLGTSTDRKLDLAERKLRPLTGRNLDPLIKDMKMRLRTTVQNCIDPDNAESVDVDIPIDGMKSFSPDQIAYNILADGKSVGISLLPTEVAREWSRSRFPTCSTAYLHCN